MRIPEKQLATLTALYCLSETVEAVDSQRHTRNDQPDKKRNPHTDQKREHFILLDHENPP